MYISTEACNQFFKYPILIVLITNLLTMNFSEIQNNTLVFNYHQEDYEE